MEYNVVDNSSPSLFHDVYNSSVRHDFQARQNNCPYASAQPAYPRGLKLGRRANLREPFHGVLSFLSL